MKNDATTGLVGFWKSAASSALLTLFGALLVPVVASAQIDTRHWIPALWAPDQNSGYTGDHYVIISTPEVSNVAFTLKDGAGNTHTGTVSNAAPVTLKIAKYTTSFVADDTGGWSGTHTANVRIGVSKLNQANGDGLILEAERPVYMNIRQRSGSQGDSLTSPGRKALGKDFRVGFGRNTKTTSSTRGSFFSFMAIEDGTTVTVDQFKPGMKVYGQPDANADGTTDAFTVTLNKYESYVVGLQDSTYTGTVDVDQLNGTRVRSNKLITVASGFWTGGPATTAQDVGIDQIVPVELAGSEYVFIKGNALATNLMESVTIVATQDDTNIFVNGSTTALNPSPMNAGDFYYVHNQYSANGNMYLTSSKPVLAFQEVGGSDNVATPGVSFVPPIGVDAANFVNNIPTVELIGTATIGVVARASAWVTINGASPSVPALSVTGAPGWVTYSLTNQTGTIAVESNSAVAVSLVNVNNVIGSSGYFSGFPYGAIDLDADDTLDGEDNCPDDPNLDQDDADLDGVGDLCDECDADPYKALAGACGCGTPDGDPDGDGVTCSDNCRYAANAGQTDSNGDGVGDACQGNRDSDGAEDGDDECPDDPDMTEAGVCGCGTLEVDSDVDGTPNCIDACPIDPAKTAAGSCGCGNAETDTDGDGTPDCVDVCGNGALDLGEECDDGNHVDGDGCSNACVAGLYATADTANVDEDGTITVDVQDNDPSAGVGVATVIVTPPDHGSAVVESDGRVTYTPAADYNGSDSFSYRLDDGVSLSDPVSVGVTVAAVADAPTIADVASTSTAEDTGTGALAVAIGDVDEPSGASLVMSATSSDTTLVPNANITFGGSGNSRTVTITPAANRHGTATITLRVTDATSLFTTDTLVLTVTSQNDAPTATADDVAATEGVETLGASLLGNDVDVDGDALTAQLVAGPAHGTLELNTDGTFRYVHDGSETTADQFTYRLYDGSAHSAPALVSISVTAANDTPVAVADALTAQEGASHVILASGNPSLLDNDTDADGNALSAVLVTGPAHGALELNANGTFRYTHDGSETTVDEFSYAAHDGLTASAPVVVAIAVTPVNDAPVATADSLSAVEGAAASELALGATSLLGNDVDPDGDTLSAVLVDGPTHGTLDLRSDGSFEYVHDGSETTADQFSYRAFDGEAYSGTVTVAVVVTPANDAPVAGADALAVDEEGVVTALVGGGASLLGNDTDAEGDPLTAVLVSGAAHGALVLQPDGSFLYAHDGSETTTDQFSYAAHDGTSASAPIVVNIAVTPRNDAPVAVADAAAVGEGAEITALSSGATSVLANDGDAEGGPLTAVLVAGPAHGTLELNADGSFRYVHDGSEYTSDEFSYAVSDGNAASAPVVVAIAVNAGNDAPGISPMTVTVAEGGEATAVQGGELSLLASASDPDGDDLSAVLVAGPAHGTLQLDVGGTFRYAHDGSETTSDSFTIRASDGLLHSAPVTVSVVVTPMNDSPSLVAATLTVAEGTSATLTAAGASSFLDGATDAEGDAISAVLVAGPAHGALTLNVDGTFSYLHDGSETTEDAFTIAATDGQDTSAPLVITIAVTPENDAPTLSPVAVSVHEGGVATQVDGGAVSLLAGASDAEGAPLTAALVTGPEHGWVELEPDGAFRYIHDGSETTEDAFTIAASDGDRTSGPVTVSVVVTPVNDGPTVGPVTLVVAEGESVTSTADGTTSLLAVARDADGDPIQPVRVSSPQAGSLILNPDGTFEYKHDGSEVFLDTFSFKVTDGTEDSEPVTVTVAVTPQNDAPVAQGAALRAMEGASVSRTQDGATSLLAGATDAEGDELLALVVSGPSHGTLSLNYDGTFLYLHDGSETTADAFTFKANDETVDSAPVTVTIAIDPVNDAPRVDPVSLVVDEGGSAVSTAAGAASLFATVSDPEDDTVTLALISGPDHGSLELNADGTFRYRHDGSETLEDGFTVVANDGFADSAPLRVTVVVTPVNDAPNVGLLGIVVAEGETATTTQAGLTSLLEAAYDDDGDALTAVLVTGPVHGTFDLAGDGTFRYAHDGSEAHVDSVTFFVTDGGSSSEPVTVYITIEPANDAPIAFSAALDLDEGGVAAQTRDGALSLLDTASDAEGDALTAVLVSGAEHGSVQLNVDGTFRYRHDGSETTVDTFTYAVSDGPTTSAPATVTVTIRPVNDAPSLLPIALLVSEGGSAVSTAAGSASLLAGAADAEGDAITLVLVSGPGHGALELNADGTFRYTHDGSETTADEFTVKASDGQAESAPVVVSVAITPVSDAPSLGAVTLAVAEGETVQTTADGAVSLIAAASDAEGDTLTAQLVTPPQHGEVELAADGTFRYTHDGSETTADAFTIAVSDGAGDSAPVTVTVAVTPVNDAPVGGPVSISLAEGATITNQGEAGLLAGVSDAEGDDVSAALLTPPSHGKLTVKPDGSFRYTHDGSETASDTFTFTANDGAASSEPITVTIAITLSNDLPSLGPIAIGASEGGAVTVTADGATSLLATAGDGDGDALEIVILEAPAHGSLEVAPDGSFEYVHDGSETTADAFTVAVTDGEATSAPITVPVTVFPKNDSPTITSVPDQVLDEDRSTTELGFKVGDAETNPSDLVVLCTSSDHGLIPHTGITIEGEGEDRTVTVASAPNAHGTATITLIVSDGSTTSSTHFEVEVVPVVDPPTITSIPAQTIYEDAEPARLPIVLTDADTNAANLVVTARAADPGLIPASGLTVDGDGADRTLLVTAAPNASGETTVTVTVTDGDVSVETRFDVIVSPVNDAPELSAPAAIDAGEKKVVAIEGVRVTDIDAGLQKLSVTASAANGSLLIAETPGVELVSRSAQSGDLVFLGSVSAVNAALATLTYTADPVFDGTDAVSIRVSDLGNTGVGGPLVAKALVAVTVKAESELPRRPQGGDGGESGEDGADSDGAPTEEDRDGDGLSDAAEAEAGTNPELADTDADGLEDGDEVGQFKTDPLASDSDGDGLDDLAELDVWETDPRVADTDEDGLEDGLEIARGEDPLQGVVAPVDGAPAQPKSASCTSGTGGGSSGGAMALLLLAAAFLLRRRRL